MGSLTSIQKSVLIGCILGDGYLRIFKERKNTILEINHSFKQKEYVDWKYKILQNISGKPPKQRKTNGNRIAYRFYTKQLPELTEWLHLFYKDGTKTIPDDLILDPMILAVWFMDDGGRCGLHNFYFNTQQFSINDQEKLITKLQKIGLESTLNKDKEYWRIRILKSSISKLRELIGNLLIPSMRYKCYNPLETCFEESR